MGQTLKKPTQRGTKRAATKRRVRGDPKPDDWMLSSDLVATKHLKDAVEALGSARIKLALRKIANALRIFEAMPTRAQLRPAHLRAMRKVVEACMKQAAEADSNSADSAPDLLSRIRLMERGTIH